jgi:O-antigen/teichoic acid export membrane protein
MKKLLRRFFSDPIFKQGGVIFASSIVVNVLNLVFWLYMVRHLAPQDYGVLNTFVSVLMLFCVPVGILQTVVTRYTSKYMAHKQPDKVKLLLSYFISIIGIFLAVILFVLIVGSHYIAAFLQIDEKRLLYAVAAGIIFNSFITVTLGALAGLQRFNDVAINSIVSVISKLFFGFVLVALGLRAFGGLLGFVFSVIVGFCLSLFQLPKGMIKLKAMADPVILDKKDIFGYFLPVGLSMLCFFALTNMDIILVKHYFPPIEAGFYSVAQMVGKIVLFVPGAVGVVMFPKIVDHHSRNESTKVILRKCLWVVGTLCGLASFFALICPAFILKVLTGHDQPQAIALVKFFAVSMSFFALINIFMIYHLSLRRMRFIYLMSAMTIIQFLGIWLFHSTLTSVLLTLTLCSAVLFYFGVLFSRGRLYERA